jgi:hypothetical protein
MRFQALLLGLAILLSLIAACDEHLFSPPATQTTVECDVTTPNGIAAGEEQLAPGSYGNREVSVGPFGLWPDGTYPFGASA